jgi:polyisoprenoid-binding protein YceI
MISRVSTNLIALILTVILAACSAATEPQPAQQPVSEAAATAPAPATVEASTSTPEPPAPTTNTPASAAATEEPADAETPAEVANPAPTEPEAAAATSEPAEPAESAQAIRTFQVVAEQSEASYQVQEEFFNRPVNIFNPVGRTNAIEGEFHLDLSGNQVRLLDNQFIVDLRTLASDDSRRDQRIRSNWLESDTYPWAEFKATAVEGFPENAAEGQDIPFKVVGDMTIREITKPVTFDTVARLDGDTFTGTATTYLLMRDYGFEPPSILGMLQVTDGVTVTVKFTAQEVVTTP